MGGKSTTSTQQVTIPPEVLARYNEVNARAENVAQKPFQQYTGGFVAPINQQQQAGFNTINNAANMAQPYYQTAAGMTLEGSQGVGPLTHQQIGYYQSPYTQAVADTTYAALRQQQQQEMQGATGNAIRSGAFGGDRSGLVAANLARQQQMGTAQSMSSIYDRGYTQALQAAQGQQGIRAQDLDRLRAGGAQLGGLGTAAQESALKGGQAQVGAGTLEQQTEQADLTAKYQQFLQERGYDFQVAQFLANIAMGTGALSGSTTTTTQPQGLFSDERMKENIEPVGELNDGQTIYRYNYKGDPRTQIGLIAQEVEQSHPEAVGESDGYRTVDYARATDEAAGASRGGLVPGGMDERMAFAPGGLVDPNDLQAIIASQAQSFGPFAKAGLYGGDKGGGLGAAGYVPSAKLPTPKLITAGAAPKQQASGLGQAISAVGQVSDLGQKAAKAYDFGKQGLEAGKKGFETIKGLGSEKPNIAAPSAADLPAGGAKTASFEGGVMPSSEDLPDLSTMFANRGGLVPGYAAGGAMAPTNPYELNADPLQDVLEDQSKNEIEPLKPAPAPGGGGGSSGLGDAIKVAGQVASLFAMSDARLKDNIEPVGKLYDGQPVYRYDMNGGPTQIGLMAQEAGLRRPDAVGERGGYMTLDYDRATEDAAGLMPRQEYAGGGLASRYGYATRGAVEPPDDIRQIIVEEAERRGIPPDLALRMARTESSFNPNAVGRSGEGGLFQIMPSTARDPGYGVKPADPDELRDPRRNAGFGLDYLKARAERAGLTDWNNPEQVAAGLRAYNGGGDPRYVQKIMGDSAPVAAIDRAAPRGGAPVPPANIGRPEPTGGLSGDGTTSGKPEGISAPSKFGSDQPQGWGDFLTSRQFIVPLLSGIGAAATTPTRNLGTALAAGLGAGAQAYGGLEKQMADVEQTRAQTRGVETTTFQKSLMQTPYGNFVWLAGGELLPAGEYDKLRREGRAPPLLGRIPDNAEDVLKKFRESQGAVKAPGATTPGTTPAAPGGEPTGVPVKPVEKGPLPPPGINYDKDSQSTAEAERNVALSGGPAAQTAQTITDNYLKAVVPTANAARDSARYLTELAANLSNATQGKGLDAPGFGFDGRAQAVSALNTLSRAFGGKGDFGVADEISETNKKIETLLSAATAAGGNQESFAALNALKQAVANPNMSPRAYSKLSADLLTHNQRAIDREQHRSTYANDSSGLLSKAAADFERTNPASKYNKEAEVIQRMILTKPDLIKNLKSGKYTPAQIDEAFENFGLKGMSRYFVGGA